MRVADQGGAPRHGVPGGEVVGSDGPSCNGGEAGISSTLAPLYNRFLESLISPRRSAGQTQPAGGLGNRL